MLYVQIFFPRSIEGEMTQKEQQRTRRRQRAQHYLARLYRRNGSPTLSDAQSCISITQQSKTELDQYDPFAASLGTHQNGSVSVAGLPSYEVAAARQLEAEQALSLKMPLDDKPLAVSISLQPNRRTVSGDIELGGVLSSSEVDLVRARSKRDRGVSSLVQHWRSPIGALVRVCVYDVVLMSCPSSLFA